MAARLAEGCAPRTSPHALSRAAHAGALRSRGSLARSLATQFVTEWRLVLPRAAPLGLLHTLSRAPLTPARSVRVARSRARSRRSWLLNGGSSCRGLRPSDFSTRSLARRSRRRAPFAWLARALARDAVGY